MASHCRRRSAHRFRRSFLKVSEAETSADLTAFTRRLERAIHEAEVLGMPDVKQHLDAALRLAAKSSDKDEAIAGEAPEAKSIGQHTPSVAG